MTLLQRQCLEYYTQPWPRHPFIQAEAGRWNNRQVHWALERGYIAVGAHGAHEITDAGRAALSLAEKGGEE